MKIKILGGGCSKCEKLYKLTLEAVNEEKIEADIEKIQDFKEIMKYGVMKTPALVINEKVVASGMVPKKDKIKTFLK